MTIETDSNECNGSAKHRLHPIVGWLQDRVQPILDEIHRSAFWHLATSPDSDPVEVKSFMEQVYLEIANFQPQVHEAAIVTIAQMPRSMELRRFRAMLVHQAEEFDHGEMARRDYVGLGNDIKSTFVRLSPEAFAVSGVWWMIARQRNPFAYLGALFLFEGLTPQLTSAVIDNLRAKGFDDRSLEYMKYHSTEDFKHANLIRHLISGTARQFPESVESIQYGFECLSLVYPVPLLAAAYRRSRAESVDENRAVSA
jgi:Iron-containing redox enzyme